MAKVKGAFGGLRTTGTVADTYTFADWKGINVVKSKPVPSNPNTTAQQAERGQHTDAVAHWHDTLLTVLDKLGYALRAQLDSGIMTGFNKFISLFRLFGTTNVWSLLYAVQFNASAGKVKPYVASDAAGSCDFKIIRGQGAGYSENKVLVAGVSTGYTPVDINSSSICMFDFTAAGKLSQSGYFRAVVGGM